MQARLEIQRVVRAHHGWVLARLVRTVRDLDLAEDALQDALAAALDRWPREGVPDQPRAWLFSTARHKIIDELRRRSLRARKAEEVQWLESLHRDAGEGDELSIRDDMLRLVFTCCHPALAMDAQVALTLRSVAGLETEQIARAFLVSRTTMAQRLVRAKKKIRAAQIPYRVPGPRELPERVAGVLAVVYLVFNEGYAQTSGQHLLRRDLCAVAIRLGRSLAGLLPDHGEVLGLLGLMLLHDARSGTRVSASGDLVLLEDQDRTRWDAEQIEAGLTAVRAGLTRGPVGPYGLQAAIAALHAEAKIPAETDWAQIVALYDRLLAISPTPVVHLNRAVAVAMASGPAAGLALLGQLAEALDGYHLFHAARADLLRRLDRAEEAAVAYRAALALPCNAAERRFLERRLASL